MTAAREKIVERIRQLREMTAARGCTEAEALSAAAKAAELMAKHGLTDADVVIEEAASIVTGRRHEALQKLWAIVAIVTNCAAVQDRGRRAWSITFVGREPGPLIAAYLRDVLDRAVLREIAAFKAGPFYRRRRSDATRKAAVADFLAGLILRLTDRLLALFAASISDAARQIAADARDARYATKSVALRERKTRFDAAADEGWRAGARPNLSHGVSSGDGTPLKIGRSA